MNIHAMPDVSEPTLAAWLGTTNDLTSRFVAAGRIPGLINVAGGLPDPGTFPTEELAEIAREAVLDHPQDCLGYGPTSGLPELREAIAARYSRRGLRLGPENVLLTASGTQALDLIGKVLIEPGAPVAAQFPTYAGALDAWRPRYPSYRHLDLTRQGFEATAALKPVTFAYLIPNFSNPTGYLVSKEQRAALVGAAHETRVPLVEDDPYGALQYDGAPLPTMLELSAQHCAGELYDGPVIYLGSVSKQLAPGLRVGWIIAAPRIISALASAKQASDLCSNGLAQRIVLSAMEHGLIERLQPRLVDLYRERRDALCTAMEERIAAWFEWEKPVGGMFIWARARDRALDIYALVERGVRMGVLVGPGNVFDPLGTSGPALRLNFTLNPPARLAEAMTRLQASLS
jgi:2-aminoadipate transaminase